MIWKLSTLKGQVLGLFYRYLSTLVFQLVRIFSFGVYFSLHLTYLQIFDDFVVLQNTKSNLVIKIIFVSFNFQFSSL